MSASLSVRQAEKTDLPQILRLYAQPDLDDGQVLGLADAQRIFERLATYPSYRLYVATQQSEVVGSFALLIVDNLGHMGAPSAIIEDIAVAPEFQSQGIGRAMIEQALAIAAENGCYKAMLSSNLKRDRAHQFYDSLGFERHGYSYRIHPKVKQ